MRRLSTIVAVLFFTHPTGAQSPSEVRGTVVEGETGLSLPLVHVFLDGTSHGDVTADDGAFSLPGVPQGTYELIVSYVGYDRHQRSVVVEGGDGLDPEIQLPTSIGRSPDHAHRY